MKIKQKILAVFMTTILLGTNLLTLGNQVIAASTELDGQNSKTNHANVEFNSYLEGNGHERVYDVDQEAKIYINLQVKENGYLKNGIVEFSNSNYQINSDQINSEYIQKIEENKIYLKQINYNQNITLEIPIYLSKQETVSQDIFAKDSTVNFQGSYIDGNGKERTIEKTVTNRVIWRANAELEVTGEITKYIPYHIGEEYGVFVQAKINTGIKENKLPIESTQIEVDVPEMNQVKPTRVNVVANTLQATNGDENGTTFGTSNYTYDAENAKITIQVQNAAQEGNIAWKDGYDEYFIHYIYTGEEIYNLITQQLEQAKQTVLTEEEKEQGKTNTNAIVVEVPVKVNIKAYNGEETNLQMEGKIQSSIEEEKGELTDFDISYTKEMSKGYIYANYAKTEKEQNGEEIEEKKQTEYEVNYHTQIYDIQTNGPVEYDIQSEKFVVDGEQYSSQNNVIIKEVKIAENIFQKILGEEGTIQVNKKDGTTIATINKETTKDENGNYVLDIADQNMTEIVIRTSNPIIEGKLELTVKKAFKTDVSYTKTQMQTVTDVVTQATAKTTAVLKELTGNIKLTEPVTKAQISIEEGKENLSTVIVNQDVSIRIVLDTSSVENALYQNPVFEIEMPEQVEDVKIKDINLLLEDELTIKESSVQEKNGKKVIRVVLEGTQTKYKDITSTNTNSNVIANGANIIINTDITLDRLTPSKTETINLYYTNENTDLYEKSTEENISQSVRRAGANALAANTNTEVVGTTSTQVNLVAPTGVVPANGMRGYDDQGSEIVDVNGEKQEATIETYGPERTVTIEGVVTNNYENSIENVFILGRVPFTGNKEIDKTTELGSTFDMQMTSQITTSGIDSSRIKIYYSTNGEATRDLLQAGNSWTETPGDLSTVKSYLIVISGEVAASTQLSFSYQVNMPGNLSYNNSSYTTYKVYYDNKREDGIIGETEESGAVGVTTGEGPELEIELTSNIVENEIVKHRQYVRFWVDVTNKGTTTAENVEVTVDGNREPTIIDVDGVMVEINNDAFYIVNFDEIMNMYTRVDGNILTLNVGDILAGETKQVEYEIEINSSDEEPQEFINQVSATADNLESTIMSNEYRLEKQKGVLQIVNKVNTEESEVYQTNNMVEYEIILRNVTLSEDTTILKNVQLTIPLPNDINVIMANKKTFEETTEEGVQILEDKIIVNIDEISSDEYVIVKVQFRLGEQTEKTFSTKVSATVENATYYSNERYVHIGTQGLAGEQLNVEKRYVKEGEKFSYNFTIQTTGTSTIFDFVLEDTLPEEVSYLEPIWTDEMGQAPEGVDTDRGTAVTIVGDDTFPLGEIVTIDGQTITIKIQEIPANTTFQIKIYVEGYLQEEIDEKLVTNTAKMSARNVEEITLNSISHYIEYDEEAHENRPQDPNNPSQGRYKITGTAWIDSNQDGTRENEETLLQGIDVILLYASNYQIVQDTDTQQIKRTTTNNSGIYEFSNLTAGEYLVIFLYDTGKYSITEYQVQEAGESYNSDAISMRVVLDGEQRYVGMTDTIRLSNGNARDIDIGLYESENFDLRLDKYIKQITLTTPTIGTTVYEYNDSQLEKVEILSQNINKSSIVVEYKIVVTNEGQVPGYARKIVDYLPEDARFNSELNTDWYLSDNNQNVYNASLAESIIQPGESREVTLILSFNITDKNIGQIINNNAEIAESYNEQGIADIDSVESNQMENEDDISRADIVLGVVTGTIVLYVTLTIAIIAIIIMGIILIKKKLFKNK